MSRQLEKNEQRFGKISVFFHRLLKKSYKNKIIDSYTHLLITPTPQAQFSYQKWNKISHIIFKIVWWMLFKVKVLRVSWCDSFKLLQPSVSTDGGGAGAGAGESLEDEYSTMCGISCYVCSPTWNELQTLRSAQVILKGFSASYALKYIQLSWSVPKNCENISATLCKMCRTTNERSGKKRKINRYVCLWILACGIFEICHKNCVDFRKTSTPI